MSISTVKAVSIKLFDLIFVYIVLFHEIDLAEVWPQTLELSWPVCGTGLHPALTETPRTMYELLKGCLWHVTLNGDRPASVYTRFRREGWDVLLWSWSNSGFRT